MTGYILIPRKEERIPETRKLSYTQEQFNGMVSRLFEIETTLHGRSPIGKGSLRRLKILISERLTEYSRENPDEYKKRALDYKGSTSTN